MSTFHDETAADVIVFTECPLFTDLLVGQNARPYQDISRVSREELEDRFLRLYDETLLLKQHIHKQDDKIKKLGTKLMRLVKDRGRMEQLAAGGGSAFPRVRDLEREELVEELQEKVRALQGENEGLKQRLLVAKQQVLQVQSRRTTPYGHVQPRINSGMKRLRDDTPSPSQLHPKSARSVEGGGRPPTGQLPRYGHSLLEDARAEIRNLHNVIESQQSQIEEMDQASELLRDQLRKKETEYEERLLEIRQQQTSKLRSNVSNNVTMIKLQKELTDRANAITILEGRFLQLQESHNTMKTSHDAAMVKVVELTGQLKDERLKSLNLERQLQNMTLCEKRTEELQDQINDLVKERDLLKENHDKLVSSAFDVSQQQKWRIQEQQLKLQIAQLEMALKADLTDKNEILDKIKAERDNSEKLAEEKKQLQIQVLEQKQQLDELNDRMKFYTKESEVDVAELTEALMLIKVCKSQKNGELGFLEQVEEETLRNTESSIRELRAAHAETIQELEKTRNMLSIEHKINKDYKVELEAVSRKMDCDKIEYEQRSERQAQLLDMRAAKIKKLEAQLRNLAYGTKTYVFKPDITDEDEADEFDETVHLERGENLLELQIVNATLPPSALEAFGDSEPATFCSYAFYDFEVHSTPVVTGHNPKYGFTSQYVVCMGDSFLEYLHSFSVTLELHLAMGLDYRTVAKGQLRLRQLLEQDGKVHGTVQLVGISDEIQSFGSVDYWMRLRIPMKETIRLYKERVKAMSYIDPTLNESGQLAPPSSSCNVLYVTVQCCRNLPSRDSQQPSPYVIYKFFDFPEHDTATVQDCCDPQFHDLQSYSVLMDMDLDRYLKSDALQFYVFDYKDEQMDTYLGKARVPLLSLAHDKGITGVFELANPSGLSTGHIEVTLKWKFTYMPPPGSTMDVEPAKFVPKEMPVKETDEHKQEPYDMKEETATHEELKNKDVNEILKEEREVTELHHSTAFPDVAVSNVSSSINVVLFNCEEEPEEDESHYSEGQVIPVSSQSCSDDSEISEEIIEKGKKKPSDRVRVEIVSLGLRPESRVAQDSSVVRLFVEYSLLDLPTEETPLSLPKPLPGKSIHYNYSNVIHVDVENNQARRELLKGVLQGHNPQMESIRFTVVSEPPEEEEQERECEDVGVAYLRIPDILEKQQDVIERSLNVVDVEDTSVVVGSLTVSVEGLEAMQAIMEDPDREYTPVSALQL
uniref:RPGRIP1 like n=1 Tax=Myripristis murdjan TaxID=586833 RepID=A0A667ZST0_9TELE